MRRANAVALALVVVIAVVTILVVLTRVEPEESDARRSPTASPSTPAPTRATVAPVPAPHQDACYLLEYDEAVAPTSDSPAVECSGQHTAQTFHVDRLDLVADGHLLAVDSDTAREQAASTCRTAAVAHLGASIEALRLSMIEATWFTPTTVEAHDGADWLRCDLVAASDGKRLVPLPEDTRNLLANDGGDDLAMCGTAAPGEPPFSRVVCSAEHTWRAIASVDLPGSSYPTAAQAGRTMEPRCREEAARVAGDPLDLRWTEERPTREQWEAGRRYGLCWVPTQDR